MLDHVLKVAKTDSERLLYLGSALENLRGTFFLTQAVARRMVRENVLTRAGFASAVSLTTTVAGLSAPVRVNVKCAGRSGSALPPSPSAQ